MNSSPLLFWSASQPAEWPFRLTSIFHMDQFSRNQNYVFIHAALFLAKEATDLHMLGLGDCAKSP